MLAAFYHDANPKYLIVSEREFWLLNPQDSCIPIIMAKYLSPITN